VAFTRGLANSVAVQDSVVDAKDEGIGWEKVAGALFLTDVTLRLDRSVRGPVASNEPSVDGRFVVDRQTGAIADARYPVVPKLHLGIGRGDPEPVDVHRYLLSPGVGRLVSVEEPGAD